MNILYLGYWSINEGISHSTIFQHLKVLADFVNINSLIYCSIEREVNIQSQNLPFPKVKHIPLHSKNLPLKLFNKWLDFFLFPRQINRLVKDNQIDLVIGAGTQAGTLALKAARHTNAWVLVSFFDPHAQYMRALGIWKKYDPRYLYLNYWEEKLKKQADWLFPVSHAYQDTLLQEGVDPEKLHVVPCTVDLDKFKPDKETGLAVREKLGFKSTDMVGIYVGKFGDIYMDEEAFVWFRTLKERFKSLKLIILTGQDKQQIAKKLNACGFTPDEYFLGLVSHHQVPSYLNAADFALSLIKPHKMAYACSPIKNGEYWACGLPIIIPDGIGDDSRILKKSNLGVVIKNQNCLSTNDLNLLKNLISNTKKQNLIVQLAKQNRHKELVTATFENLLSINEPKG
jgi:glycosyltransferase involved in cell wall biosynthesis